MPRPGLTERNAAEIISSSLTDGEKEKRVPKVVVKLGTATKLPFLFKNVNIKYKLGVCQGYPVSVCKPVFKCFLSCLPAKHFTFFNKRENIIIF